jgi:hypothetical protein
LRIIIIIIIITITTIIIIIIVVSCHAPFLPGTPLEPAVPPPPTLQFHTAVLSVLRVLFPVQLSAVVNLTNVFPVQLPDFSLTFSLPQ